MHKKSYKTQLLNGNVRSGYIINIILNSKNRILRSSWEFYTLAFLRLILKYESSNIEYERCIDGRYPDFYIKSLNHFIECHPDYDDKLYSYEDLNIKFSWYHENRITNIKNKLYQLHDSRFPIDDFDYGVIDIYSSKFCYDFDNLITYLEFND